MATIQTTQLEERETGDIKQLRDHDIAEGPVSTNSADATSLKSVPLTLEDGSIIKVRFDSLVTAIGQALGASEDSTVTKVLGLNGTVPKGIGMANLASVLGVYNKQGGYPDGYFSSLVNPGTYHTYGDLCVVFKDDDTVAQLLFQLESSGDLVRVVARVKDGNKDWSTWKNLFRSTF